MYSEERSVTSVTATVIKEKRARSAQLPEVSPTWEHKGGRDPRGCSALVAGLSSVLGAFCRASHGNAGCMACVRVVICFDARDALGSGAIHHASQFLETGSIDGCWGS